ncbi:hypothetical protein, conserved [Eimeria acervulina]|uniref:Ribosomal protein L27 n=1 Tax=Eimeria acervulina TaxID=5801 RepID=U6GLE8_EIMAC|nr:hypothetical protein, conserved [Eimeria acervulina]CDI79434.1 hypothetical protein, conserved [Eimeria acervulina]
MAKCRAAFQATPLKKVTIPVRTDGGFPSARASVHSKMTKWRRSFFFIRSVVAHCESACLAGSPLQKYCTCAAAAVNTENAAKAFGASFCTVYSSNSNTNNNDTNNNTIIISSSSSIDIISMDDISWVPCWCPVPVVGASRAVAGVFLNMLRPHDPLQGVAGSAPSSGYLRQSVRFKMVKSSAYHRRSRASPTGQSQKAHLGVRRLSAEFVSPGCLLVKQRRYIAWGFESKRRKRHQKIYPGENVGVAKDSSLVALVHGRVKYTHEVSRQLLLCNVLPEPREELLRSDLWRYRTEHVQSKEENRHICHLRRKAIPSFPKPLINPPTKPLPRPKYLSRKDAWQSPTLPDAPSLCEDK